MSVHQILENLTELAWVAAVSIQVGREAMAGFRPQERQYDIDFKEGHPLHGLKVTMGSLTLREYNEVMQRSLIRGLSEDTVKANDEMIDLFVQKLLKWNYAGRDGKILGRTKEDILGEDRSYMNMIITAWQIAMMGISDALGKDSPSGEQSEEESLGLES